MGKLLKLFYDWFSFDKKMKQQNISNEPTNDITDETTSVLPFTLNTEMINSLLKSIFCNDNYDPLLAEIILFIVNAQSGSTSLVQRNYSIGYNRAGKIMDQIEKLGIVGMQAGAEPREVLIQDEKDLLAHLKIMAKYTNRYKDLEPKERRELLKYDLESIFSKDSINNTEASSFKDLDEETLANLDVDENDYIVYPNGVKLRFVDGAIYYDNIINETTSILGYNSGEFYISNHTDDGYIESDYMRASCLACWELFTDKLICLIRNDHERVNYEFMRKCQKAMRGFYRHDAIKIRLRNGTDSHTISRDFLEKVLNTSISIPFSIDKKKLMEVLYSSGIDIVNTIEEIIGKDFTQYELCTIKFEDDVLYNQVSIHKHEIESKLFIPSITIQYIKKNTIRIGIPNYSVNVGMYQFTFGGENGKWMTNCLQDGYSMLTLTELINNNEFYRSAVQESWHDDNEKRMINIQAECYSRIDKDILNSRISKIKFSDRYDSEQINYIAMAAFYKQCDVLLDDFIESTHGEYEIISKTHTNGMLTTKVRAYHETFIFTEGHSMHNNVLNLNEYDEPNIEKEDTNGYIYVMINPSLEGMVKIGKTKRDPNERVKELSSATGVPTPFILVFYKPFRNCDSAEKAIHHILEEKGCRINDNREFFNISSTEAIKIVQLMYDEELKKYITT